MVDHGLKAWHQKMMAQGGAVHPYGDDNYTPPISGDGFPYRVGGETQGGADEPLMAGGGHISPEVLGGGTGLPLKKGGSIDHELKAWHEKNMAEGGMSGPDSYQQYQATQAQKSADISSYKQGKIGADELVKYFPGLTPAMVEAQVGPQEMAKGGVPESHGVFKVLQIIQKHHGDHLSKPLIQLMGEERFNELKKATGGEVHAFDGGLQEIVEGKKKPLEQAEIKALPQTPMQEAFGWLGQKAEAVGKTLGEATKELKKTHPKAAAIGEFLVSDPLQSAGTALQDWTGTPREVSEEYPVRPSPIYGGPTLQTFKFDPRAVDVLGFGQVGLGAAERAAKALPKAIRPLKPIPAGLSTEPVKPIEEVLTPKVEAPKAKPEEIKAPANELGLYSQAEKAVLNMQRKQGSGDAFISELKKAGVSNDEMEFTGLNQYLKGKKAMTKADLEDFMAKNRLKLSETEYKGGVGDEDRMRFGREEVIDDQDWIDAQAEDIVSEFDTHYYPGRREEIREQILERYTPDELEDPAIIRRIDNEVEEEIRQIAQDDATQMYYENPYVRFYNDEGYEIIGNDDVGWSVRDPRGNYVGRDYNRDFETAEGVARNDAYERGLIGEGDTKYHDYQLPEGENYRELLLQIDQREGPTLTEAEKSRWLELSGKESYPGLTPEEKIEHDILKDQVAKAGTQRAYEAGDNPHWDEDNVLLHMRLQDRQTADGKPMLYVDEMQSDWHQQGSDRGYYTPEKEAQAIELEKIFKEKVEQQREAKLAVSVYEDMLEKQVKNLHQSERMSDLMLAEYKELLRTDPQYLRLKEKSNLASMEYNDARQKLNEANKYLTDAPYKENWHELGVKRILNKAAQEGYDRVGFSSARPQIKRWGTQQIAWEKIQPQDIEYNWPNFSKWVDENYPGRDERTKEIWWERRDLPDNDVRKSPSVAQFKRVTDKEPGWMVAGTEQRGGLAGTIDLEADARARGILKESKKSFVANKDDLRKIVDDTTRGLSEAQIDRITNKTWERMQKFDTGISAPREEGMRAFYDNKLKNFLQKYAKKIGAEFYESETNVGRGVSETGGYKDINEPVYVIEFTDKAKKSALKGQPYKKGGLVKRDLALMSWHKQQKIRNKENGRRISH